MLLSPHLHTGIPARNEAYMHDIDLVALALFAAKSPHHVVADAVPLVHALEVDLVPKAERRSWLLENHHAMRKYPDGHALKAS